MKCPKCQHNNDSDAKYCEKCGKTLEESNTGTNTKLLIVAVAVLIAILGVSIGYILNGNSQTPQSTPANVQVSQSTGFPVSEVPNLAAEISKSSGTITSVQYNGVTLDKDQCLYIFSKGLVMINSGQSGNIAIKQISSAEAPYGELSSTTLTKSEYVDMADRTYKWIDSNGITPNHTGIKYAGSPDLSPDLTLKAFTKALTEYKSTGQLPQNISVP